jgi:hypothetical protein
MIKEVFMPGVVLYNYQISLYVLCTYSIHTVSGKSME